MINRTLNYIVIAMLAVVSMFATGCENEPTKVTIAPGQSKLVDVEVHIFGAEDDLSCSARLRDVNLDAMDVEMVNQGVKGSDCFAQLRISIHEDTNVGLYKFKVEFSADYTDSDGNYESETETTTVEVNVK